MHASVGPPGSLDRQPPAEDHGERLLDALLSGTEDWSEGRFRYEFFTAGQSGLDPAKEHAFQVELADSGLTLSVGADETLFDALRAAGIDIQSDCGEGLCGTCEARVLSGPIDHRDRVLSKAEKTTGTRLMTCCSRAQGNRLVLAL